MKFRQVPITFRERCDFTAASTANVKASWQSGSY